MQRSTTTRTKTLPANLLFAICISQFAIVGSVRAQIDSPELAKYNDRVDKAVDRGLEYLARNQVTDDMARRWNYPPLAGSFLSNRRGNTGITSLCVMAFLSKGCTPGDGPYGDVINRGIDYIVNQQADNGLLVAKYPGGRTHGLMYEHCISTLMLCEASGMVDPERQKRVDAAISKALAVILRAQLETKQPRDSGGWRYNPNSRDSDLSLTGWAIMALRAGKLNGAPVPDNHIAGAVQYILKCRSPRIGGFGYQPGNHPNSGLTGVGILCLELCGEHGNPVIEPAAEFLLKQMPKRPDRERHGYYAMYYCSQAFFQLGGKYWETFAPVMYENMLDTQHLDGSWRTQDHMTGTCYSTSMAILAMTVAYRQLPIYQRDESFEE